MKPFITAIATALLVSACAAPAPRPPETSTASQPASHNAADVTFASDMIPHHTQAVQMAALVPTRSTDPAVIKLAADVSAAQGPEIETMKGFLAQWNAGPTAHADGGMTMPGMPGMVDDATMVKLATLTGTPFDDLWLSSMIGHHEGAIAMADTELANGANADAKRLAQQIITTQQAEITQMKTMGR